ncbi:ABC transporter ATP-binding protein [Achromobacter denitrificans]|jgi:branched-chain amino acid transport system ATP-binding protein|uniref:ABC transporter ATP-binding protein n=1 Tax=Achromobacter denitrificans TaxID=32002 RepID=A0A3R9HL18_ACHDE|nr:MULTISPECIES: ABC transporter ATP-binding protein [Achromobacter]ASC67455.1 ABC transporter ATP-binding protein [Achromobacter denitrificans]MBV2161950.1 ABC transporter ATP-binding protein [Achromobacter denitrificans]MDF3859371.1 ABC transporter ATP-binding protein [Achromobacter denitrificans]MDF3941390.1 ABC transporter ATP-binding protein [Achromobacter denitrificans]MDX3988747.1 ABC transporter ATP-binding protein [Achromobacter sp.]
MNAIEVKDLAVSYGQVDALHGISFDVPQGTLVSLIGANGAGKTTLLKALMGALPARAGRVLLHGDSLGNAPVEERVRRGMCLVPEKRSLFASMKVEDNLRLGAYAFRRRTDFARELDRVYALFPVLAQRREQLAGTLSGGEQQMVAIGRALIAHPRVLLLDEPSIGLAPLIVQQIMDVVVDLRRREGLTVILVEQNARIALKSADLAYLIELGRIVKQGSGAELAQDPDLLASYLGASAS